MTPRFLLALVSFGCAGGQSSAGSVSPAPVRPAFTVLEHAPPASPEPPPQPRVAPPVVSAPPAPEEPPIVPVQVVTAPPAPGTRPPATPKLEEWQRQRPGAIWPPPGYVPAPCELEVSTKAVRRGKVFDVIALVNNKSGKAVTLSLPSRCPQGPVVFHGLGESYDYYRSCAKGACAGPREPERFTLAPGRTVELAAIEIDPKGDGCTGALPEGRHAISFSLPFAGQVCAGTFASVEGGAASKPTPAKPEPRAPCPPMPACGIACPGGEFARDANGCTTCGCVDRRGVVPP